MALTGLKINELDNASVITNETVLPVVYVNNGSASDTATKATLEQVKELVQEDNYTKTETDILLNKKQDKLTAGDNITITEDSDEVVIASTGGSSTEEINIISATSGTIELESNKVYKASLDGSTTFALPSTVDNTIFNQIYLQLDVTDTPTVDFGTTNYMTIEPVITSGVNLICYEYNSNEQAWYVSKVGESGGGGSTDANTSLSNLTNAGKIQAARLSMPGDIVTELTVVDSTFYTAISDGYITIWTSIGSTLQVIVLKPTAADESVSNRVLEVCLNIGQSQAAQRTFIPIRKGQKFVVYGASGATLRAFFAYAQGSESEYTPS